MQRLLTVCGSFHGGSANRAALDVARSFLETRAEVRVCEATGIDRLAAFDPTLATDPPDEVATFLAEVDQAQGLIVAGPEYAGGVAGSLKNALDWCVGSAGLYRKPVVVMSAGTTGGTHAIAQLVRTLLWQGAHVVATVGIAAPKTKSDASGRLVEPGTVGAIETAAEALLGALQMTHEARALGTRELAERMGIGVYPHMPD